MKKDWIKNANELAIDDNRKIALDIISSGLDAIDTKFVIRNKIQLEGEILHVEDQIFDLSLFKKITVIGFGKASIAATQALEEILGSRINGGAVVGTTEDKCSYVETFVGTHPRPSIQNVRAGERITDLVKNSTADDLVIAIVSGGGSALFCSSLDECTQGAALYDAYLSSGKSIGEMNIVRKHLSYLKGGGLAKVAYPATVVGLLFSDVPGNHFEDIASGPTYKDNSTTVDAQRIVDKYNLGSYDLIETPKEDKYFENVHNFVLVSNDIAVSAMKKRCEELNFGSQVLSLELYENIEDVVLKLCNKDIAPGSAVLGAGEPKIEVTEKGGMGGRNTHMALTALHKNLVPSDSVFISFASDGKDNTPYAGAIVDKNTIRKFQELKIDSADYLKRFDSGSAFLLSKDLIDTGPTGANVSDLMLFLKLNNK